MRLARRVAVFLGLFPSPFVSLLPSPPGVLQSLKEPFGTYEFLQAQYTAYITLAPPCGYFFFEEEPAFLESFLGSDLTAALVPPELAWIGDGSGGEAPGLRRG